MEIGFLTDNGMKREHNEDTCYVSKQGDLFIVADGVGGQNAGEIASKTAVEEIVAYLDTHLDRDKTGGTYIFGCIAEGLEFVNQSILEKAHKNANLNKMATTIVLMYVKNNVAYITNMGDSRAYLIRKKEILQLTEDHTLVNKFIKEGKFTEEEIYKFSTEDVIRRLSNTITRALGDEGGIEPDHFIVDIEPDDVFLLCSDGLYGEVTDEEILHIVEGEQDVNQACLKLVEVANDYGGGDNITVILVKNGELVHE